MLHTTITTAATPHLRVVSEIEALERALAAWKHWELAKATRAPFKCDSIAARRLYCMASDQADEAMRDTLVAAYALFELDGIYDAAIEAGATSDDLGGPDARPY
jgi:hypothetical protein